jgi:hypothetical protein
MLSADDYRGRFGSQRPTQEQRAILERQGVRQDVIVTLTRQQAFELIQQNIKRWLQQREQQALHRQHYQHKLKS